MYHATCCSIDTKLPISPLRSFPQVEILVDDGLDDGDAVLATSLGGVTVSADLYDENLAADGGCDPNGCTASNTQVG